MIVASTLHFNAPFFWHYLLRPSTSWLGGLGRTVYISVLAQIFAVVIGLIVALVRRSKSRVLRALGGLYVWVLRGTPLLVQLVLVYDGLAAFGLYTFRDINVFGVIFLASVQAAIVTLALNESAYMAEIIRAGLAAVDPGQNEAALSIGMTPAQSMRHVVIPQSMRFIIPPLGNDFNAMMKATSVLSIIGVPELFLSAQAVSSSTVAALYYLALTTVWTYVQAYVELRIDRSWGIVRPNRSLFSYLVDRVKSPRLGAPARRL
jgi:polar amino acid transport system permease protein